jgi:hypothetical protein
MSDNTSRWAVIENGIVINIILADADFAAALGAVPGEGAQIGWQWDGTAFAPPVSAAPTAEDFERALTEHLDSVAQARRYDSRVTCALRAGYPGPFQAEGQAFALWMDQCNAYGYQRLAAVQAGQQLPPESVAAFLAELPPMVWPE